VSRRRLLRTTALGVLGLVFSVPAATVAQASVPVRAPTHVTSFVRGTAYSSDWSGYADYGTKFQDVRGSWTQPAAICTSWSPRNASFWIGLDGYNSNSVEQIGADSDCAGLNTPVYSAWFEMFPKGPVTLPSRDAVRPGDHMSAEVSVSGTSFKLVLADTTRAWSFTTHQTSTAARDTSAEWVAEAPSSCSYTCIVTPLADFGAVHFTGAATISAGRAATIASHANSRILMVNHAGRLKALPTALATGGNAFTDTWYHS